MGYVGAGLSTAMSALFEYRREGKPKLSFMGDESP